MTGPHVLHRHGPERRVRKPELGTVQIDVSPKSGWGFLRRFDGRSTGFAEIVRCSRV